MNQFRNQPHMVLLIDGPFVCSLKKKILGSLRGEEEKKKKKKRWYLTFCLLPRLEPIVRMKG